MRTHETEHQQYQYLTELFLSKNKTMSKIVKTQSQYSEMLDLCRYIVGSQKQLTVIG